MNATERARRSDALYYDNISRRELCDRIANLESDLEDSKAKNAKLRELVAEIYEDQCDNSERWRYRDRMRELGIRVNDCE